MRILIAGDQPIIRKGIREILSDEFGIRSIKEASDGMTAYELLITEPFGLAIVDFFLPGKDGLALIKDVLALRPRTPFLVISANSEWEFAQRAYQNGAKGFLSKTRPISEYIEAIRSILGGRVHVSPEFSQFLVERLLFPQRKSGLDALTDRELAVLRLFTEGRSLTRIGEELHISVKTVSTHKSRIQEKLGKRTNADLLSFALKQGLGSGLS